MFKSNLGLLSLRKVAFLITVTLICGTASAADSVMDILKPYYPLYNEALGCHGAIAPSGSVNGLTREAYMTGYCIDIDRQKVIETDKGKRLYILITGDVGFDEDGEEVLRGHADSGLVGMFVLKPQGSGWEVEYVNPVMNAGASGAGLKDWKLIQVAPDKWGFINIHSDSHWVHSGSAFILLTPDKSNIRRSWVEAKYEHSNGGSGSAGGCSNPDASTCTLLKAKLGVDKKTIINGFYPLEITLNGFEDDKVYKNQVYLIKYQPRLGYQVPNDYPMKDVSF